MVFNYGRFRALELIELMLMDLLGDQHIYYQLRLLILGNQVQEYDEILL